MSVPPTERPPYVAAPDRYDSMPYRRVGVSGPEAARSALWLRRPAV